MAFEWFLSLTFILYRNNKCHLSALYMRSPPRRTNYVWVDHIQFFLLVLSGRGTAIVYILCIHCHRVTTNIQLPVE